MTAKMDNFRSNYISATDCMTDWFCGRDIVLKLVSNK